MLVVTAKEERGASAIEVLVLLKDRRHLMHAPPPRRTRRGAWGCGCCARYRRRRLEALALLRDGLGEYALKP
jgi:hypothetical protein